MTGPHAPIDIEPTFDRFAHGIGARRIDSVLPKSPSFENADYHFPDANVIAELKEVRTDFWETGGIREKHLELTRAYIAAGHFSFRMALGVDKPPPEFVRDFLRLFKPPLARILKKANRQLKSTKLNLSLPTASGVLLLVNDTFASLEPEYVSMLVSDLLTRSYSSVDCFIYMTVNAYVTVPSSEYAHLLWMPCYSETAPDALVTFVDTLGRQWFDFLEKEIGPWDVRTQSDDRSSVKGARVIRGAWT